MGVAPDYAAALFVTPGEAYQRILSKIKMWKEIQSKGHPRDRIWRARHLSLQTAPGDQVLGLVGERGGGKTWLLRYLAEDHRRVSSQAVYLDLAERASFSKPMEYVRAVEEQVREQCGNERAILLLDSIPPYLDEHLRAFEDAVLEPQLAQRGSLVIMALTQPQRVCWRVPTLQGAERLSLPLFDEPQTREQLGRLHKTGIAGDKLEAPSVHGASGGLPLLNYLLATRNGVASWEAMLEYWLVGIPTDDRDRVRSCLEAVCTLDSLEHVKIQRALETYRRHQPKAGKYPSHPGDVRNILRKHGLAHSMPESPGRIVLVDSMRRATQEVLQARSSKLYAALTAVT